MNPAMDDNSRKVLTFPAAGTAAVTAPPTLPLPTPPATSTGKLTGLIREHGLPFALGAMVLALSAALIVQTRRQPPPPAAPTVGTQPPVASPATPVAATPPPDSPRMSPAAAVPPPRKRSEEASHGGDIRNAATTIGVRFTVNRTRETLPVPSAAIRGWEALRTGELEVSRDAYGEALREDARSLDALRGLAAIAERQGRGEEARRLNRQILEIAPKDTAAESALGPQEEGGENAMEEESRLKTLAASDAAVPAVHFALGNLYARQQRWKDAEHAYFEAVAAEPGNPDYHYNLAVCLDQLTQPQLAAQYYKSALARTASHAPAFDPALARSRLAELEAH